MSELKKNTFLELRHLPLPALGIAVLLAVSGCYGGYNLATREKQYSLVGTPKETELGRRAARKVEEKYKLYLDPVATERVSTIAGKIAAVSDRQEISYSVKVLDLKEVNAFSLPGGFIYVNRGLVERAGDDELACVIAHEIGHVAAKHNIERLTMALPAQIIRIATIVSADSAESVRAVDAAIGLVMTGYSRQDELVADRLAVRYASKAGYDPHAMAGFLRKLNDMQTTDYTLVQSVLRTHPNVLNRVDAVEDEIENLEVEKQIEEAMRNRTSRRPENAVGDNS